MPNASSSENPALDVEVILPVHNEGASIEATIRAMYEEFQKHANVGFIICEDGSKDDSKQILRRLASELPMRLNLSDARKGYSKAVRDGMAMAEAPSVLCVDSDGQCAPCDFAQFWNERASADVLLGWRVRRADTLPRRTFSRFFFLIYQIVFRIPVHDPSCPYVLFSRQVAHRMAKEMGRMKEGFWWEFVARAHRRGYCIRELPIQHRPRSAGITQVYRWTKMPGIFLRHVAALWSIWQETRTPA